MIKIDDAELVTATGGLRTPPPSTGPTFPWPPPEPSYPSPKPSPLPLPSPFNPTGPQIRTV